MDGQGTTWLRNIAENFNRLSRAHQRYRRQTDRQTDGWPMTYSEHELEFIIIIIIIIRIYLNRPELILSRGCGLAAQSWSQTSSPCVHVR